MRILVNGLLPNDSGKTTFSLSLIRLFRQVGIELFPLKPMAGHNAWYSFNTLIRSEELGALAGNDALKYYDETKKDIRKINPFAVLFIPIDLEKLGFNVSLYNLMMDYGFPYLIRFSDCITGIDSYFVNSNAELYSPKPLLRFINNLSLKFNARSSNSLRQLIDSSPYNIDVCVEITFKENENVIIESYNDSSSPTNRSADVDYVFIVSPAKAFLVKGDEFKKALSLYSIPPWNVKVSSLIKYLKIEKSFEIDIGESIAKEEILDWTLKS
ncbi:ATPase [Sulfolobus sp. A20]|uniref:ATPase n=1 Tax=Sulfolobaceae TaxID=118883 RepID=UPI000845C287|nr:MULTISPECIES: ATPase [unclassified Sulfolobus]TRM74336.1 ATPase [Sulfolobus sp. B5]TRM74512.1 ATPase [Sulfolobus sp. E5]TRM81589.1 ATPase [Sulfolobus sp. D5]TRM83435.1 ATPase [Sulfolobus sp. A20-N-F6]TRM87952.1 ATPase [Sulfolobus sp. C3]TRM88805.1 ATPase [Sulfolobus sp. E3]TRM89957.1 ATPase [Sulfolobus sp. A20-N-G8]TRM98527.1 ATPase [Sulfolobus sp. F1]TRN04124.1 ATPase [Sulfolobus sp. E1]